MQMMHANTCQGFINRPALSGIVPVDPAPLVYGLFDIFNESN